jgi:hypothetical protein
MRLRPHTCIVSVRGKTFVHDSFDTVRKKLVFTQSPIRACGFIVPFAEHSGARRSSFYEQLMPYRAILEVHDGRWRQIRLQAQADHIAHSLCYDSHWVIL